MIFSTEGCSPLTSNNSSYPAIEVSNISSLKQLTKFGISSGSEPFKIKWSKQRNRIAVSSIFTVSVFDGDTQSLIQYIPSNTYINAFAISPDGSIIAIPSCSQSETNTFHCDEMMISIWSVTSGELLYQFSTSLWELFDLAFSPDGHQLAAGGCGIVDQTGEICISSKVTIWDIERKNQIIDFYSENLTTTSLDYSPNGLLIATGGSDGSLLIYNISNRALETKLTTGCDKRITNLAFSPDGKSLAAGCLDMAVVFDTSTWSIRSNLNLTNIWVDCLAFSTDSKQLMTGNYSFDSIITWDLDSGKPISQTEAFQTDIRTLAVSPDGKSIAFISPGSSVGIVDKDSGRVIKKFPNFTSYQPIVAFNSEGSRMALSTLDGNVEEWDPHTLKILRSYPSLEKRVYALAYQKSGVVALTCTQNEWSLIDPNNGKSLHSFSLPYGDCEQATTTINHSGTYVAISNPSTGFYLVDLIKNKIYSKSQPFQIWSFVFTKDDRDLAVLSNYGIIYLYNMHGQKILQTDRRPPVQLNYGVIENIAFTNNSKQYVMLGQKIGFGSLSENSIPNFIDLGNDENEFFTAGAINNSDDLLVVGGNSSLGELTLIDLNTRKKIGSLTGMTGNIQQVLFSPDNSLLIVIADDGSFTFFTINQ